ncbi:MAG: hypothetical protein AAFQ89_02215 [Cyanobacteria bacterium J06626_18]
MAVEDTVRESVIYQDILRKGTQVGMQQEAQSLIQRLLRIKVRDVPEEVQAESIS